MTITDQRWPEQPSLAGLAPDVVDTMLRRAKANSPAANVSSWHDAAAYAKE